MKRVGILSLFFLLALVATGEEKKIRNRVTAYLHDRVIFPDSLCPTNYSFLQRKVTNNVQK